METTSPVDVPITTTGPVVTHQLKLASPQEGAEERDKRIVITKPITEVRKAGRKIVRPSLEWSGETSIDIEMSGVEGSATEEGRALSSHESEPSGVASVPNQPSSSRKRAASSSVSELREAIAPDETSDEVNLFKRPRESEPMQEAGDEQATPLSAEDSDASRQLVPPPMDISDTQPPVDGPEADQVFASPTEAEIMDTGKPEEMEPADDSEDAREEGELILDESEQTQQQEDPSPVECAHDSVSGDGGAISASESEEPRTGESLTQRASRNAALRLAGIATFGHPLLGRGRGASLAPGFFRTNGKQRPSATSYKTPSSWSWDAAPRSFWCTRSPSTWFITFGNVVPLQRFLEQKLAAQYIEMERLATENQRIAATHSTLRKQLASTQLESHRLQIHMNAVKFDHEQHMRALLDKNARMEAELQASDPLKADLQQAHAEVQNLVASRQELILKVQQLNQELQRSHGDAQQIPALMSELESLRQEYEHCRWRSCVPKLANAANPARSGGTHGANVGHKDNDVSSHHSVGQPLYEDGFGDNLLIKNVLQVHGSSVGTTPYGGGPPGPPPPAHGVGHDAMRGHSFDAPRSANFDGYGIHRSASAFEAQRGGSGYDAPKGIGIAPGAGPIGNNVPPYGAPLVPNPYGPVQLPSPYGAGQPPAHMGSGYEVPHGVNVGRR
ncbi:hypothetical protein J5N97_004983 [Dioscorea zingiberensis]|uniref:Uncharacterized protein n=1 Tax=Dioscorea zingiberensis TaxID=325984 RepID=A0A9D5HSP3_9LILI|nr:hypothetical protein J5N97_004983 [Dioscorea zingiberensis]